MKEKISPGLRPDSPQVQFASRFRNCDLLTSIGLSLETAVLIMDAFTTISAIFAPSKVDDAVDTTSSYPVDEETGGSGGTAYCVIA